MADPRADDVARAKHLLDEAAEQGVARLPVLSAAELWVLCGDQQVLADDAESRWWATLTEPDRARLAEAMIDLLADRGLLRRTADAGEAGLPMTPELALIVAARQAPAAVALATLADGSAEGAPRLFVLAEGERPPRVVVAEIVGDQPKGQFGRLHHFSLLSTARAGHALATWATGQRSGGLLRRRRAGQEPARIIDVYRYLASEELERDRVTVSQDAAGGLEVARQRLGGTAAPATAGDLGELAGLLTAILAGAA